MAKKIRRWLAQGKAALDIYYSAPLTLVFYRFRNGLIYFSVGLVIIILANQTLPPSLKQDLITLAGLILAIIGFVLAMLSHMRLIIGRFYRYFKKPTVGKNSEKKD